MFGSRRHGLQGAIVIFTANVKRMKEWKGKDC